MNTPSRSLPDYAELRCISNFTFLRGASHPHELVERAHALGYRALALTDECSLAGAVRAHVALRRQGAAGREARERFALLSAREREVLARVIQGLTSKQIARVLQLSPRTVETHRAHLQDKLQVQTLAQLVRQYAALVDEGAA